MKEKSEGGRRSKKKGRGYVGSGKKKGKKKMKKWCRWVVGKKGKKKK